MVREKVRVRDKHKCRECKKLWRNPKRRFDVHHLNGQCGKKSRSYDQVSTMSGLITLCHSCHMKKHASRRSMFNYKLTGKEKEIKNLLKTNSYSLVGKMLGVSHAAVYWKINGRPKSYFK